VVPAVPPPLIESIHQAEHMIYAAALQGDRVYAGTQSGVVQIFARGAEGETGELLRLEPAADQRFPPSIRSLAFTGDGRLCAAASSDDRIHLLRLHGEDWRGAGELSGIKAMRLLFDEGSRLIVGEMGGEVGLLDPGSGEWVYRNQLEYDPVSELALAPGGDLLAVAFASSRIQLLEPRGGTRLARLSGHRDQVFCLAWLDRRTLLSGGKDKRLLCWRIPTEPSQGLHPEPETLFTGEGYITALAAHPGRGLVAFSQGNCDLRLLAAGEDREALSLKGHEAPLQVLGFDQAGHRLLSAGNDARLILWSIN